MTWPTFNATKSTRHPATTTAALIAVEEDDQLEVIWLMLSMAIIYSISMLLSVAFSPIDFFGSFASPFTAHIAGGKILCYL